MGEFGLLMQWNFEIRAPKVQLK